MDSIVGQRAVEAVEELANAPSSTYDEPVEVAFFSRDPDRSVRLNDRTRLKAFVRPELETSLNDGFESFVDKVPGAGAPLGDVLSALAQKGVDTSAAHFITYRNNLIKLLHTPYSKDPWRIGVSRHGRTIHLHVLETEEQVARERAQSERERRMAYWGYAFESACTASEHAQRGASDPLNANEEFVSIAQGKLGGNRLVMAGEVDCEKRNFHEVGGGRHAMRRYVEIKTTKVLTDDKDRRTLERFKMSKWWLQSFLLGVPTVVCGFRDDDGVLRKMQDFPVKQLPKFVHGAWKPHVMLNFGSAALGWVYERVVGTGPAQGRYVLEYEPARRRLVLRIAGEGVVPDVTPAASLAGPGTAHGGSAAGAGAGTADAGPRGSDDAGLKRAAGSGGDADGGSSHPSKRSKA